MSYVLFIVTTQKKEAYLSHMDGAHAVRTADLGIARRFETARDAYDYGARKGLGWWRVGQR